MRHRNKKKILDRPTSQRRLLRRNMAVSLILSERIKSTTAKVKWLRPFVERLVTLSRRQNLAARRRALALLNNRPAVNKLMDELAKRYAQRPGGYTRIVKVGARVGDGAECSIIEFVDRPAVIQKNIKKNDAKESKSNKKSEPEEVKDKKHEKK